MSTVAGYRVVCAHIVVSGLQPGPCGHEINSPTPAGDCGKCGAPFRIEWPANLMQCSDKTEHVPLPRAAVVATPTE